MQIDTLPKRMLAQVCPYCKEEQDVLVNGFLKDPASLNSVMVDRDRGYSFCNCKNIFFTDKSNIEQAVYSQVYFDKYNTDHLNMLLGNYVNQYGPAIKYFTPRGKFLEVGCINPTVLNGFKSLGYETSGMDIFDHPLGDHRMIVSDFEKFDTEEKFDVIWASHVFEHFIDPVLAVKKAYDMLNAGGSLFVAMPDPFFIEWKNPYTWAHWHLSEHYILWDMDCFIKELENAGFKIVIAKHNVEKEFICLGDFHIIARKEKCL